MTNRLVRCLDLFSGCGGLSLGLSWAKFQGSSVTTVAALDNWRAACETYTLNLEIAPTVMGVSTKSVAAILDDCGDVDLVVGGPPCQGFSSSGKRALSDRRNHLVRQFLDSVALASPKAFIMENVAGFTTFQGGLLLKEVTERAQELGFRVHTAIVLASRFGVPQRRRRFIMIGVKSDRFQFPHTSTDDSSSNEYLDFDQRTDDGFETISFNMATNDLPSLRAGEMKRTYRSEPRNHYQTWIRGNATQLEEHMAPNHSPSFVKLMTYIPEGQSAFSADVFPTIPRHLRPQSGFANSYARIRGTDPCPTVTRNFTTPSSANCIHPRQNRALSLREGARCQSFPDTFKFAGSHSEKRLQIGNAVPPLLGRALGESILKSLAQ